MDGSLKICDFNVSKRKADGYFVTEAGTQAYMAPELIFLQQNKEKIKKSSKSKYTNRSLYDEKVDIWSFGCIMFEICNFALPFQSDNLIYYENDLRDYSKDCKKIRKFRKGYSDELKTLILTCLEYEPDKRPSASEILEYVA